MTKLLLILGFDFIGPHTVGTVGHQIKDTFDDSVDAAIMHSLYVGTFKIELQYFPSNLSDVTECI